MALHITPEMLEAAYELLRATPPFNRWKLPHADDVEFHVTTSPHHDAICCEPGGIHVSGALHSYLPGVLQTMAHEMIHLYHMRQNTFRQDAAHGEAFRKAVRQVCRYHGFDPKRF